jgi:hypothetical protein
MEGNRGSYRCYGPGVSPSANVVATDSTHRLRSVHRSAHGPPLRGANIDHDVLLNFILP